MNKNILKIDLISLGINLCLLFLLSLSNKLFNIPQVFAVIFGIITLGTIWVSTYFCNKSDIEKTSGGNALMLIGCILVNFAVYCLPFLGLYGRTGVNGAINYGFCAMYFGRIWIYVYYMLKGKSRNAVYGTGKTLNSSRNFYKIILVYGWFMIVGATMVVIVGMFVPIPDLLEGAISNTIRMSNGQPMV